MSEESRVVRVKVETVTPMQRTVFLVLLGTGLIITGMVASAYGWLDAVVSVIVVAAFHLAMNWRDPSTTATARPSRMAGTLAQAQSDAPFLSLLLSRQSRIFELAKGTAKGLIFVLAKTVLFHGYTVLLTPINLMQQDLPWAAFAILLVAAACAWHWGAVMTVVRPLLKMRPVRTTESAADVAEPTPATTSSKDS